MRRRKKTLKRAGFGLWKDAKAVPAVGPAETLGFPSLELVVDPSIVRASTERSSHRRFSMNCWTKFRRESRH